MIAAWRRWSPWRLRSHLAFLGRCLADERRFRQTDYSNTEVERAYRFVMAALAGEADPHTEADKYRVEGDTLVIDGTRDGSMFDRIDRKPASPPSGGAG